VAQPQNLAADLKVLPHTPHSRSCSRRFFRERLSGIISNLSPFPFTCGQPMTGIWRDLFVRSLAREGWRAQSVDRGLGGLFSVVVAIAGSLTINAIGVFCCPPGCVFDVAGPLSGVFGLHLAGMECRLNLLPRYVTARTLLAKLKGKSPLGLESAVVVQTPKMICPFIQGAIFPGGGQKEDCTSWDPPPPISIIWGRPFQSA